MWLTSCSNNAANALLRSVALSFVRTRADVAALGRLVRNIDDVEVVINELVVKRR